MDQMTIDQYRSHFSWALAMIREEFPEAEISDSAFDCGWQYAACIKLGNQSVIFRLRGAEDVKSEELIIKLDEIKAEHKALQQFIRRH